MAHPLFVFEPIPGIHLSVKIPVAFHANHFTILVSLSFVENIVGVAVDLKADGLAAPIDIGDLINLAVTVKIPFNVFFSAVIPVARGETAQTIHKKQNMRAIF